MGVNQQHILILGANLPKNTEYDDIEKYNISYWEKPKKFQVLYDGMSGKYVIAGRVLAGTYADKDFFSEKPIKLETTFSEAKEVADEIKEKLKIDVKASDVHLMLVTHNS